MLLGYLAYQVITSLPLQIIKEWSYIVGYAIDWALFIPWIRGETNLSNNPVLLGAYKTKLKVSDFLYYGTNIMKRGPNPILYGIIVVATILLIIAFKRSIREKKSLTGKTKAINSAKEKRLVPSVIAVCVIYIFTAGPRQMLFIIGLFDLRFINRGPYYIYAMVLFILLLAVNHSINIFVYLTMNSKFRGRFKVLFGFTRQCTIKVKPSE